MDLKRLFRRKTGRPKEGTPVIGELSARGRLKQTENQLRDGIRTDPDSRGQRIELADVLVRQGRFAEAVAQYLTAADSHARNDQYEHAIRLVRKALTTDPENMEAAEQLARLERVRVTLSRRDRILEQLGSRMRGDTSENRLTPREFQQVWPGIGSSPLIADLSDDQLFRLIDVMEVQRWRSQLVLCRQGQYQAQCHLIAYGTVEAVTLTSTGNSRVLLLFGPGDLVGDSLLLGDGHLQATYRTGATETTALRLTKRGLKALERTVDHRSVLDALRRHGRDREVAALLG